MAVFKTIFEENSYGEPEKSVPIGNSRLIFGVAFMSRTDVQEQ